MMLSRVPSHFIFDLDGVLLDTEPFYTRATQTVVERYGKTFDWAIKANMIGRPALDSARYLVEALELPIPPRKYLEERQQELERLFPEAEEIAGAEAFTRSARAAGIMQGVATSSERRLFECKTRRHRAWFSLFETVVCGSDERLQAGKPAPDIFLLAASELGAPVRDCLVFEDSPVGVEAARAAGMQVVAVPDPHLEAGLLADADLVIENFCDLRLADLGV